MSSKPSPPAELLRLVETWRAKGALPQGGFKWPRSSWIAYFPACDTSLRLLPDHIDWEAVREASQSAGRDPEAATEAFLASMIWGFGNVGYGRWRTKRILAQNPHSGEHLAAVANTCRSAGALSAYKELSESGPHHLPWLGPAFGTKFLSFVPQHPSEHQGLILDDLVATWLRDNEVLNLKQVPWSPATYAQYLDAMHKWAAHKAVQLSPMALEEIIFGVEWDRREADRCYRRALRRAKPKSTGPAVPGHLQAV